MHHFILALLVLPAAPQADTELVDLKQYNQTFGVFTDGKGRFIVSELQGEHDHWLSDLRHPFYGDGKVFTEATPRGQSITSDDPRYEYGARLARVSEDATKLSVGCGNREVTFNALPKAESDAMLAKAVFKRTPVAFIPYTLARDDKGTYYYVDKGRYEDNLDQFRVWVGPRGAMKPMKLTNVVHDSAGDIFATAKGDLRLITGNPVRTEWWASKNKSQLTDVPISNNLRMIFNDLGPYKNMRLGTPCDDL